MRAVINRAELLAAARRAASIAPVASPVEVLKGVLLEMGRESGTIAVTSTNLELSLVEWLSGAVGEDDAIVVNAKLFAQMLEKLADDTVTLTREGNRPVLSLQSGTAEFTVPVFERGSYPRPDMPFPEDTVSVSGIPAMTRRTVFAASDNAKKPLLKCVNLMFTKDGLQAASTDGGCVVSATGDKKSTGDISLLLPAQSLERLAAMISESDEFRVGTTGKNIVFYKQNFMFSARLMDGIFIDTKGLIDAIRNQFVVLSDVQELKHALHTVLPLAEGGKVELEFQGQRLTFHCEGAYGKTKWTVETIPLTGAPNGTYAYLSRKLNACLSALSGPVKVGVAQDGMLTLATEDAFYMQRAMLPSAAKAKKAA